MYNKNYYDLPTPTTMPMPKTEEKEYSTYTGGALKNCATFTSEAAQILASPKFSLLINGLKLMCSPSGGDYGGPMERMIGTLMVMGSPVWGVIRVAIGLPATVIGGAATMTLGVIYGAEKTSQCASNALMPKESKQQKMLVKSLVERMHDCVANLDFVEKKKLLDNPNILLMISFLKVAFLSRKIDDEDSLKICGKVVSLEDLNELNEKRKGYFKQECNIKEALQSHCLELNEDDEDDAWKTFMGYLEELEQNGEKEPEGFKEKNKMETLKFILEKATDLSESIVNETLFQKAWAKSLQ